MGFPCYNIYLRWTPFSDARKEFIYNGLICGLYNACSQGDVERYEISPKFDKDVLTYEVYVPNGTKTVKINATKESSNATVSGTGEVKIETDKIKIIDTVFLRQNLKKLYLVDIQAYTLMNQIVVI